MTVPNFVPTTNPDELRQIAMLIRQSTSGLS